MFPSEVPSSIWPESIAERLSTQDMKDVEIRVLEFVRETIIGFIKKHEDIVLAPAPDKSVTAIRGPVDEEIDYYINIWSMRPQPGTPTGIAWESGARQGWYWGKNSTEPLLKGHSSLADMISGHIIHWRVALEYCRSGTSSEADLSLIQHELKALEEIQEATTKALEFQRDKD